MYKTIKKLKRTYPTTITKSKNCFFNYFFLTLKKKVFQVFKRSLLLLKIYHIPFVYKGNEFHSKSKEDDYFHY